MIKIVRQKRKSMSISIDDALQIVVKAPMRMSEEKIYELIKKKKVAIGQLIQQKQDSLKARTWFEHKKILFLGDYKDIIIRKEKYVKTTQIIVDHNCLIVVTGDQDDVIIKAMIQKWCKDYLENILVMYTKSYAEAIKCSYNSMSIRNQKTRWGSCSSKRNLSYNVKLICAPLEVIQYVILHEVMHLKYFNHSKQFWQGVETLMPDYRLRQAYLKEYGNQFEI